MSVKFHQPATLGMRVSPNKPMSFRASSLGSCFGIDNQYTKVFLDLSSLNNRGKISRIGQKTSLREIKSQQRAQPILMGELELTGLPTPRILSNWGDRICL